MMDAAVGALGSRQVMGFPPAARARTDTQRRQEGRLLLSRGEDDCPPPLRREMHLGPLQHQRPVRPLC
jgi:hypothetical protein